MPQIFYEIQWMLDFILTILCDFFIEMVDDLLKMLTGDELLVKFPQLMHTYILNTI